MAIAIDTTANSGVLSNVSAATINFNMGAVSNGILVLLSAVRDTASTTDGTITSATYRGTAMTKVKEDIQTGSPLAEFSAIWYILNPYPNNAFVWFVIFIQVFTNEITF